MAGPATKFEEGQGLGKATLIMVFIISVMIVASLIVFTIFYCRRKTPHRQQINTEVGSKSKTKKAPRNLSIEVQTKPGKRRVVYL